MLYSKKSSVCWGFEVTDIIHVPKQLCKEADDEIVCLFWTGWCQSSNVILIKIMVCLSVTGGFFTAAILKSSQSSSLWY